MRRKDREGKRRGEMAGDKVEKEGDQKGAKTRKHNKGNILIWWR